MFCVMGKLRCITSNSCCTTKTNFCITGNKFDFVEIIRCAAENIFAVQARFVVLFGTYVAPQGKTLALWRTPFALRRTTVVLRGRAFVFGATSVALQGTTSASWRPQGGFLVFLGTSVLYREQQLHCGERLLHYGEDVWSSGGHPLHYGETVVLRRSFLHHREQLLLRLGLGLDHQIRLDLEIGPITLFTDKAN